MNIILLSVVIIQALALVVIAVLILSSPENSRRAASRLIGWAMFIENLYAEYDRCRAMGNDERDRRLAEFGL